MRRVVKWLSYVLGYIVLCMMGFYVWANNAVDKRLAKVYDISPVELGTEAPDIKLGERIVHVRNGCVDCHGSDLGGKSVINDPAFAVINGPNITPKNLSGWSDGEVARAIRNGIGQDGKPLLLMPSHEYSRLSHKDLAAVVGYLRTVEKVERENGPVNLGPVGMMLVATRKIPTFIPAEIIDHEQPFIEKPDEKMSKEFGKYLADSACAGCHGPGFKGGPIPGGAPDWPAAADISMTALKGLNEAKFLSMMRSGMRADGARMRLPMPVALVSQMTDVELKSLWMFLSTNDSAIMSH